MLHLKGVEPWSPRRTRPHTEAQPPEDAESRGVTSLPDTQANAARLASLTRHHWGIESLHWLRDTLYREDQSQVRTRSGPRVMAGIRILAIGAIRLIGRTDITDATRWASRFMHRPFQILGT